MNRSQLVTAVADRAPVERAARTGRNPRTGATLEIPAGRTVRVSVGSRLKAATNR